jgi:hypothetical protein
VNRYEGEDAEVPLLEMLQDERLYMRSIGISGDMVDQCVLDKAWYERNWLLYAALCPSPSRLLH